MDTRVQTEPELAADIGHRRRRAARSPVNPSVEVPNSDLPNDRLQLPGLATRSAEILIAVFVLGVTLPLLIAIAILVKLNSPGPALFFQTRLGIGARPFTFVKFRTMYHDARQRFPEMYTYSYSREELDELKIKVTDDPRVTRCGRWLRASTLDEIPNFWNVLIGDMALVGPRPEIPDLLKYYVGDAREKFLVRPGITGLAQVSGRGRLYFNESKQLDIQYVRTRSFLRDIKIILKTIKMVVLRDGAF